MNSGVGVPEDAVQYDEYAPVYDLVLRRDAAEFEFWETLAPAGSVCEVGCGTGVISAILSKSGRVTGVDISPGMLSRARQRLGGVVSFVEGDMRSTGLPDGHFDWIVAPRGALTHLLQPAEQLQALIEFRRIAKSGANVVIDIPQLSIPTHSSARDTLVEPRYVVATNLAQYQVAIGSRFLANPVAVSFQYKVDEHRRGSATKVHEFELTTSVVTPTALSSLAEQARLTLVKQQGDYLGSPLTPRSPRIIGHFIAA